MTRKVCVVTGSRAEFGLLRWLMQEIDRDSTLELQLLVTGMHLAPEFGFTLREILDEGFVVNEIVESQLASDSAVGMAKSLGLGIIGCADAFRRLDPSIVVLLGDRYEILAAAQAASLMGIPVAHISGGEVTNGAVDDWIRHAISKASWWHFVAADEYRKRLIQLGESPDRIFTVGDPGLDSVRKIKLLDKEVLESDLGIRIAGRLFILTYHPATLSAKSPEDAFNEILTALNYFEGDTVILTLPNADSGGAVITQMAKEWANHRLAPTLCVSSLGQRRYLSLVRLADAVIGNSSSGIVEAPALKVATVNIGIRQHGRIRADSIIDCQENSEDIRNAIELACSLEFKSTVASTISKYGDMNASRRMVEILHSAQLPIKLLKKFHDA